MATKIQLPRSFYKYAKLACARTITPRALYPGAGKSKHRVCVRMASSEGQKDGQATGHAVPKSSVVHEESQDPEILAFQSHQAAVARLTLAEEAKTLVVNGRFGVLSTISSSNCSGFPAGSVVEYATDDAGRPIFSFSSLSPHTGDVISDGRCSLTVMADGFRGLSDARVNILGKLVPVSKQEQATAKDIYLQRHPQSFWVEFGDFSWFKMEEVLSARLVGGFARAGSVSGNEYTQAAADPVAQFSSPVCTHMNEDHQDATIAMIKHYVGITVDKATMLSLDSLGINVACERQGQSFKCRLPFVRPAKDRKAIKEVIVEMTRAVSGQ